MGCGILFPRDYRREFDASDPPEGDYLSDGARNDFVDLDGGFTESESEDEAWWEKPNAENGIKVQVGIYLSRAFIKSVHSAKIVCFLHGIIFLCTSVLVIGLYIYIRCNCDRTFI